MKPLPFQRVFHPTDFSEGDQHAFEHALRIALAARGELNLLHVADRDETADWTDFPSLRAILEAWGVVPKGSRHADVATAGLRARKVIRQTDGVGAAIAATVADDHPDLVVLATHQRTGLGRWLYQAIAEPIARESRAMTLFVPRRVLGFVRGDTGRIALGTILVPVDREPHAQPAVDAAAALARTLGCKEVHFIFLHVGPESDAPRVQAPTDPGWTSETESWEGAVVEHILDAAEANEADLIVMAKRGQRGVLDALRGSTTERVLRGARCPVLVVPVPG
ncbi:MAG: universal stress protein [Verrucomicrobia bacterium]|nr:MAG: universal stress protein [Verrucomicrobiota bacterium]